MSVLCVGKRPERRPTKKGSQQAMTRRKGEGYMGKEMSRIHEPKRNFCQRISDSLLLYVLGEEIRLLEL